MIKLTDTYINSWNNRLNDNRFYIKTNYSNHDSSPGISICTRSNYESNIEEAFDIKYTITFSICEKRESEFNEIFKSITKNGIDNKFIGRGIRDINITNINIDKVEETHIIYNRKYKKYTYNFFSKIDSIMAYVKALEDTIEYFQLIWGYQEDGEEICHLKYPIGSIVSPINDKSKDLLVVDYEYDNWYNSYNIKYKTSEMTSDKRSPIIKYGDIIVYTEEEITYSRTNRIDNLLN